MTGTGTGDVCPNRIELRVRYDEADPMGVANHAAYVGWSQEGFFNFFERVLHLDPRMATEIDAVVPVVELAARYHTPVRFRDRLHVRTYLEMSRAPSFLVHHVMSPVSSADICAQVRTWHVFQRPGGAMWPRVPPAVEAAVRQATARWPAAFRAPAAWRATPHYRRRLAEQ